MKAAVMHEFGQFLHIKVMPVKEPGENRLLVKVITCGVAIPIFMPARATDLQNRKCH